MGADYYDARDTIQWSTITFTLSSSGSYTFEASGPTTISGSLTGSDSLILTRQDFDRTKEATAGEQIVSADVFVLAREIRSLHQGSDGPPLIFVPPTMLGSSGAGAFNTTETAGSASSTQTFFGLSWVEKTGPEWGDPETIFVEVTATVSISPGSTRFNPGLGMNIVEDIFIGQPVPWRTADLPHTLTRTLDYDILAPYFSVTPEPDEVMGGGSITLTAVFA